MVIAVVLSVGIRIVYSGHAAGSGFITRSGTKLMLNGQQYKFAGLNANGIVAPDCRESTPSRTDINNFFANLAVHSMVRIWYLDDNNQQLMDWTVAAAAANHDFLTVSLVDAASGGQCGPIRPKNIGNFYGGGYTGSYFTHVRNAVNRYKDSLAIGIWEMANENDPNVGGAGMLNFYRNTSALIKSIDTNHLVGTGSQPGWNFGGMANYEASSGPNVDLISAHEYDAATGESAHVNSEPGINSDQAAKDLNKPVYVGEDGFCDGCGNPYAGNTGSDAGNASKLDQEYRAYINDPYVAGMLYWNFDFQSSSDPTGMYFGSKMFTEEKNFNNPYPGGVDGATGSPTPTPTPPPPPAPLGVGSYNDTTPEIDYASNWQTSLNPGEYNGDDHYTHVTGDTATLGFTGNQVRYWYSQAPQHGIAVVAIDNAAATDVDLYAASRTDGLASWLSPVLSTGNHVFKIASTGNKNALSNDTVISIDRIDVLSSGATPMSTPISTVTPSPSPSHVVGDMNNDGKVNIFDLSYLLSKWGTADPKADMDHSNTVDIFDLSKLLSQWTG
jgi:mannan endo-1,4-beta-mannosidase